MPKFEYKAKINGKILTETITADDRSFVIEKLKNMKAEVLLVKEIKERKWSIKDLNSMMTKVKLRDLVVFSKNLSAMIDAGLPLSRSFSILKRQTKNPKMHKVLDSFIASVEEGHTMSEAMKEYPEVFPELFIAMSDAGEQSGTLSESLKVLGSQLEKSYTLRKKIKGAMIYPAIVIIAMFVIGLLMFIYVVPSLTATLVKMGAELPTSTKVIIAISDFLAEYTLLSILAIFFTGVSTYIFLFRTQMGKRTLDLVLLYVPKIKTIVKESNSAYVCRSLSSLLDSGVNMIEALEITRNVVPNVYFKAVVAQAKERVGKGDPVHVPFTENDHLYPILVGEMIEVGEETGQISEMLERLATFYEGEVEDMTKNISQVVEPILMLFIASAVGFFAVSMITPIYSLAL